MEVLSRPFIGVPGGQLSSMLMRVRSAVAGGLLAGVALTLAPLAGEASAAPCKGAGARGHTVSLDTLRSATRCLINKRRHNHGLVRLDGNGKLSDAAVGHSRSMVRHNFFSHTGRDGSSPATRVARTGYLRGSDSWTVAENISWGEGAKSRPRSVVKRWMRSSGHRHAILLGELRDAGVGVSRGSPFKGGGGVTYTVDFGRN